MCCVYTIQVKYFVLPIWHPKIIYKRVQSESTMDIRRRQTRRRILYKRKIIKKKIYKQQTRYSLIMQLDHVLSGQAIFCVSIYYFCQQQRHITNLCSLEHPNAFSFVFRISVSFFFGRVLLLFYEMTTTRRLYYYIARVFQQL